MRAATFRLLKILPSKRDSKLRLTIFLEGFSPKTSPSEKKRKKKKTKHKKTENKQEVSVISILSSAVAAHPLQKQPFITHIYNFIL